MKKDNIKSLFKDLDDWYKLYPQCEIKIHYNQINTEQNTLFDLEEEKNEECRNDIKNDNKRISD